MKIGIYIPYDTNPTSGGAHSYLSSLLNTVLTAETNHEFVIIVDKNTSHLSKYSFTKTPSSIILFRNDDFSFVLLRALRKYFGFIKGVYERVQTRIERKILNALQSNGIEFIYCPFEKNILTAEIPYATPVWDLGHREINYFPEMSANGEYERREEGYSKALSKASIVFAESETGKKNIEFYYRIKKDKIVVMPMFAGHVVNTVVSKEEQELFLSKNKLTSGSYLFYPAQFWAHKNHVGLLKALKHLKDEHGLTIPLVLTGADKGNLRYIRQKIKALDLESQVKYLGFVSIEEQRALYENAFALIMPTYLGPTNMPLVEAIAIGCPVLCSNLEGHIESLEDAALYFNTADYRDIASKIKLLHEDIQLRMDLIKKGKNHYEKGNNTVRNAVNMLINSFTDFEIIRECWEK